MKSERLEKQLQFILEIDKLKSILRRSYLIKEGRRENSAEHSWHLAIMAILLSEHSDEKIDSQKVIKMLLVHDLVEIDAGDTFCYDTAGHSDKADREGRAADRIFGLLPKDQSEELRNLWNEFEAHQTPESRFAAALDRLMPLLHNFHTGGKGWKEHGISKDQVLSRNSHISEGSKELWKIAESIIQESVAQGFLKPS